jgi:hypothetical protein
VGSDAASCFGHVTSACKLFAVSLRHEEHSTGLWLTLDRMLAVMTMNTGYFVSIVIGTFAGSVLLGSHSAAAGH